MNLTQRHTNQRPSPNVNQLFDAQTSLGERLGESLARFGGSWTFIIGFCGALVLWIGLNSLQLLLAPFDTYPFAVLNLALSCLTALQAPIVLMCLNRQAARDRLAADLEAARSLQRELELTRLHEVLDLLSQRQWADLVALQQHQIVQLNRLLEQQGLTPLTSPPIARVQNGTRSPASSDSRPISQESERTGGPTASGPPRRRPRVVDGRCHLRPIFGPEET